MNGHAAAFCHDLFAEGFAGVRRQDAQRISGGVRGWAPLLCLSGHDLPQGSWYRPGPIDLRPL